MAEPDRDNQTDAEPRIPESLSADLVEVYGTSVEAPPEVDDRVLAMAHEQLARRPLRGPFRGQFHIRGRGRGSFRGWRWAIPGVAVGTGLAAAAAVAMLLWAGPVREDIDRNGRVDILDAFALARKVEAKSPAEPDWDVNRDGVVDAADVDAIAMKAVALGERPSS